MKRLENRPIKDEKGQTFILILIFLLVGALIVAPLLRFMTTGLKVGQMHEERTEELYAADSGVEYGLYQIIIKHDELPQADGAPPLELSIAAMNDKQVEPIIVTYINNRTYRVNSTATDVDTGASTTIESYINILSFTDLMDNAITSMGTVTLRSQGNSKAMIYDGDVIYCEGDPPSEDQVIAGPQEIDGDVINECTEGWPTEDLLHQYYWPDVKDSVPLEYPDDEIDLKVTDTIPSLYRVGDLTIKNTGSPGASGTFAGIVYVTGDVEFKQPGNKDYDIYLNGWTIFALGEIHFPSDRCTLHGPGCIIAVGDIQFQPKMESIDEPTELDFIFVMSVEGSVSFQPNGNFYGSVAGNVNVRLQPGSSLGWNGPPPQLEYPGAKPSDRNVIQAIRTWEIN